MTILTFTVLNSKGPYGQPNPHTGGTIYIEVDNVRDGNGKIIFTHSGNTIEKSLINWDYDVGTEKWELHFVPVTDIKDIMDNKRPLSTKVPCADIITNVDLGDIAIEYILFYRIEGNDKLLFPPGDGSGTAGGP